MRLALLFTVPIFLTAFIIWVPGLQVVPQNKVPFTPPKPDAVAYNALKDSIAKIRDHFGTQYLGAKSPKQQKKIIDKARHCFLNVLQNRLLPEWYGTPWDFYGKTEVPRSGAIACGYFVATALRDMGMQVDRIGLGDLPSEDMIRKLIKGNHIKVFGKGQKIGDFEAEVKQAGDALYILGLDYHTGFLQCAGGQVSFINATMPYVMQQPPTQAGFLAYSKYRVAGCLSTDDALIKKWILKELVK